ncbi:hypothetical protein Isop_0160 [Isosphaera pallida ATCC 43644]|uniref:Uncharacterized protein n=1 Tax=Isosphaera pallida (strain ATCC 43644 / DSM 9630 / IS1B) TaxID=575540 RepID=E8R662_ISOPI|nr:hypothetical protein Isop_0160 [Isosphaera pallida ATCC 43644]
MLPFFRETTRVTSNDSTIFDEETRRSNEVRLAFGRAVMYSTVVLTLLYELLVIVVLQRQFGFSLLKSLVGSLLFLPQGLFGSFLISLALCGLLAVMVRMVLRPVVTLWYHPSRPQNEGMLEFRLGAGETIRQELPIRWRWLDHTGRRGWSIGTLALTNRRLWILPQRWDQEPHAIDLSEVVALEIGQPPRFLGGLVEGLPPTVTLVLKQGEGPTLATLAPQTIVSWFPDRPLRRGFFVDDKRVLETIDELAANRSRERPRPHAPADQNLRIL